MKLPLFFLKQNKSDKTIYFSLLLKEEEGMVLMLEAFHKSLRIVDREKFKYTDAWENLTEDVDQALSQLETRTKKTSSKLIFFVYSHFINELNHQIKEPYLHKIKILVKELELKAIGFIDALEAATNYLEEKDGSPLTAIIIEFDKTSLTLVIFKGGQRIVQKTIPKTDNLIDDLLYIFNDQKGKMLLPARIIVYDSDNIGDISSKILTHQWSEDLFIQLPKVEIIKEEGLITGLINVFAEQITAETKIEDLPKEVLGFKVGVDVAENQKEEPEKKIEAPKLQIPKISFLLFSNILKKMKPIKFPLLLPIGIAFVLVLLFGIEFFFHKVKIKVYFPSQIIKKDINLNEDVNSSILKSAVIPYDASDSIQTTGKQTVGEKARGDITIFSFNDKETHFDKGTVISVNNLKFLLDSEVTVASASEILIDDKPVKKPGEGKVKVAADTIGPDGNLAKGKRFQIGDFATSSYFGMNDSNFTGGTKKEVTTVAKKDLENLKNKIIAKAKSAENELIKKNLNNNQKVLKEITEVDLTDEQYSKEVGEEATKVDLKAKAKINYYFYDQNKILDKILTLVQPDIKTDYELKQGDINYQITKPEKKDNEVKITLKIDSRAIKKVDKNELLKNLIFKDKKAVEVILKEKYNAEGYDLDVKNPIPFLNNWTPIIGKNIVIETSSL